MYSYTGSYPFGLGIIILTSVNSLLYWSFFPPLFSVSLIVFWPEWPMAIMINWSTGPIELSQLRFMGFGCLNPEYPPVLLAGVGFS